MTIRVMRLMEYRYPDAETMGRDMRNWIVQSSHCFDGKTIISSTVLPLEIIEDGEED